MIDGVHFRATLPLRWQEEYRAATLESARYLAVLAEFEQNNDDRPKEQTELHAKLDLALLWLSRTLVGDLPPASRALIGLEQICWWSESSLPAGSHGAVGLNFSESLPFMLPLPVEVESCVQDGAQWRICARIMLEDENLREWWERTVFRRHRREIQQERGARA